MVLMSDFDGCIAAASSTGRRVALGASDGSVVVLDPASGSRSKVMQTIFSFGGSRLSVSDELNSVVAAAYHVHGIAC